MSKNSQDGSDEYEVIFDEASIETKKYDVIDAEITDGAGSKSDNFEGSDDDIEEGIFAPERREKPKQNKSSSLMVAVSVLALAGVGAFVYVSKPDIIKNLTQNFAEDSGVTVPDEVANIDSATSIVDPMNLTAPQPEPDVAIIPAEQGVSENTPVQNGAMSEAGLMPIPDATANVVSPSMPEPVVAPTAPPVNIQAATADSETVMPTADNLVDTGGPVVETAAVAPETQPVVANQDSVVKAPVAETSSVAPPAVTPVSEIEKSEQKNVGTEAVIAEEKKPVQVDQKQSDVKPAEQSKIEEKPVIVASKEEKKAIDDANLDKYFDSPGGKILSGIPAPSMDPKKGSRESLIIVNKKAQKPSDEKPVRSGSKAISIETTSLSAQTISANRALKLGRYEAAKEMYDELYRLNPKDGQILSGRALLLQKMGFADQAIAAYEELLQIYPDNTDAIVNLAGLIRKQYPAVALNKLLDLHMVHPSNVFVTAQLGVAYADSGNFDDALRYLDMAASMDPQNAQHFYNMAVISEKASQPAQAIKFYEKALDVDTIYGEGHRTISREKIYDRLAQIRGN